MEMAQVGGAVERPRNGDQVAGPALPRARDLTECMPIVRPDARKRDGGVEVFATRLDVDASAAAALARWLSVEERRRADRFAFDRDRRRFMVGRARLRQILSSRLATRPELIEFEYGPRGKPRLSSRCAGAGLRFNVSHCGDLAVYALSNGREVGVDVEAVRALPDADEIAARFFSHREYRAYLELDPRDRPLGFFTCWTRKEAFVKALGDGLYCPLDSFDVSLAPGEPARIRVAGGHATGNAGWAIRHLEPGAGFVGALVVRGGDIP